MTSTPLPMSRHGVTVPVKFLSTSGHEQTFDVTFNLGEGQTVGLPSSALGSIAREAAKIDDISHRAVEDAP